MTRTLSGVTKDAFSWSEASRSSLSIEIDRPGHADLPCWAQV